MKFPAFYEKLKIIAEMEESWDHPDLIALRFIREGYYVDTRHMHPDRIKTITDQVTFIKEIKEILLKNNNKA